MKKIISILISVALMVTMIFVPTWAIGADSVVTGDDYKTALDTLHKFSVYPADLNINPFETISRGRMAQLIAFALNHHPQETTKADVFSDVRAKHQFATHIKFVSDLGVLTANDEGLFQPDKVITIAEVTKALVTVLNRSMHAESKGGYPTGYMYIAQQNGLLTKLKNWSQNTEVNFGAASIMILNMLDTPVLVRNSYGLDDRISFVEGDTPLYTYFKIGQTKGILNATYLTNLNLGDRTEEGVVNIDSVGFISGDTGIEAYIGTRVIVYYHIEEVKTMNTIVAFRSDNNQITTIFSREGVLSAKEENNKIIIEQNNKKHTLQSDVIIVYNNAVLSPADRLGRPITYFLAPKYGNLKIIDNNNDGKYDLVVIEDFKIMRVGLVSGTQILGTRQEVLNIEESNDTRVIYFDQSGNIISSQLLKPDSVISVAESINQSNGKSITIYISNNSVEGAIDEVSEKDGIIYIKINGTEYPVLDSLVKGVDFDLSWNSIFKISFDGVISDIRLFENVRNYAWLIKSKISKMGDLVTFRILDIDGKIKNLDLTDRVKFIRADSNDSVSVSASAVYNEVKSHQLIVIEKSMDDKIRSITLASPIRQIDNTSRFNNPINLDYVPGTFSGLPRINITGESMYPGFKTGPQTFAYKNAGYLFTVLGEGVEEDDSLYEVVPMKLPRGDRAVQFYDIDEWNSINVIVSVIGKSSVGEPPNDTSGPSAHMIKKQGEIYDEENGSPLPRLNLTGSATDTAVTLAQDYWVYETFSSRAISHLIGKNLTFSVGDIISPGSLDRFNRVRGLALLLDIKKTVAQIESAGAEFYNIDRENLLLTERMYYRPSYNDTSRSSHMFGRIDKFELRDNRAYVEVLTTEGPYLTPESNMAPVEQRVKARFTFHFAVNTRVTQYKISDSSISQHLLSDVAKVGEPIFIKFSRSWSGELFIIVP